MSQSLDGIYRRHEHWPLANTIDRSQGAQATPRPGSLAPPSLGFLRAAGGTAGGGQQLHHFARHQPGEMMPPKLEGQPFLVPWGERGGLTEMKWGKDNVMKSLHRRLVCVG